MDRTYRQVLTVTLIRSLDTDCILREEWRNHTGRFSPDMEYGAAVKEHWPGAPDPIREEHWRGNLLHREDGPAVVVRDPRSGVVVEEKWYCRNEIHRPDGPAVIRRHPVTGDVLRAEYYLEGDLVPASALSRPANQVDMDGPR